MVFRLLAVLVVMGLPMVVVVVVVTVRVVVGKLVLVASGVLVVEELSLRG